MFNSSKNLKKQDILLVAVGPSEGTMAALLVHDESAFKDVATAQVQRPRAMLPVHSKSK